MFQKKLEKNKIRLEDIYVPNIFSQFSVKKYSKYVLNSYSDIQVFSLELWHHLLAECCIIFLQNKIAIHRVLIFFSLDICRKLEKLVNLR